MNKEIKTKTGETDQDKKKRIEEQNARLCADYVAYLIKKYKLKEQ
ncbi:MAG: hypothetical protein ACI35W_08025 [Anaeroplasmataceae bacterium]